ARRRIVLLAVSDDRALAVEDDEELLLVVARVVMRGDLSARLDVDDVEAECLGAKRLAGEAPGRSPAPLHLLELVDVLDRVALGHCSSSFRFPLVSPGKRTYPLRMEDDS